MSQGCPLAAEQGLQNPACVVRFHGGPLLVRIVGVVLALVAQTCCVAFPARAASQAAEKAEKPTLTFVLPSDSLDTAPRAATVWHVGAIPTARGRYRFFYVRVQGYREELLTGVPDTLPPDVQLHDLRDSALAKAEEIRARARFFGQRACDTLRARVPRRPNPFGERCA